MGRRRLGGLGALPLLLTFGCGIRVVPPPPAPSPQPPSIDDSSQAVSPHTTRVIVDAVGSPAQVDEVTAIHAGFERNKTTDGAFAAIEIRSLCPQTPCAVDLGLGSHILRYSRQGDEARTSLTSLRVDERRTVFRHELGYYATHPVLSGVGRGTQIAGIVLTSIGVPVLVVGVLPLDSVVKGAGDAKSALQTVGAIATISGLVLLATGITLKILGREEYQEGSSTQWALPTTPVAPPVPQAVSPALASPPPTDDAGAAPPPAVRATDPSLPVEAPAK